MDGSLAFRELNGKSDYGSSFASARIAGILASIDAANPIKDASDARSRLNEFNQDKSYSLGTVRIDLPYIQISSMPGKFNDYVARPNDHAALMTQVLAMKIGRASCRKSGCPYGKIRVVHVSLKKKNMKSTK